MGAFVAVRVSMVFTVSLRSAILRVAGTIYIAVTETH